MLAHIDKEKFPERFRMVEKLISEREEGKVIHKEESAFDNEIPDDGVDKFMEGVMIGKLVVILAVFIFVVLIFVLTLLGFEW